MDGAEKYKLEMALKRQLQETDDPTEANAILKQLRALNAPSKTKKAKKQSDRLRDMEKPTVLGYELDRKTLTPIRKYVGDNPSESEWVKVSAIRVRKSKGGRSVIDLKL